MNYSSFFSPTTKIAGQKAAKFIKITKSYIEQTSVENYSGIRTISDAHCTDLMEFCFMVWFWEIMVADYLMLLILFSGKNWTKKCQNQQGERQNRQRWFLGTP